MGTLEIDAIREYLLRMGCKIEYPILVNAFKQHLYNPDPNLQGQIRTKFKDYVNQLAIVSLENNMKFIILRPEFRQGTEVTGPKTAESSEPLHPPQPPPPPPHAQTSNHKAHQVHPQMQRQQHQQQQQLQNHTKVQTNNVSTAIASPRTLQSIENVTGAHGVAMLPESKTRAIPQHISTRPPQSMPPPVPQHQRQAQPMVRQHSQSQKFAPIDNRQQYQPIQQQQQQQQLLQQQQQYQQQFTNNNNLDNQRLVLQNQQTLYPPQLRIVSPEQISNTHNRPHALALSHQQHQPLSHHSSLPTTPVKLTTNGRSAFFDNVDNGSPMRTSSSSMMPPPPPPPPPSSGSSSSSVHVRTPIVSRTQLRRPESMDLGSSVSPHSSQMPPPRPPPRRRQSTASLFKQVSKPNIEKAREIGELAKRSPGKVKEHALRFSSSASSCDLNSSSSALMRSSTMKENRLSRDVTMTSIVSSMLQRNGSHASTRPRSSHREDESDSSSLQPIDPLRRQWAVEACNCNYNALLTLLRDDPKLAAYKDVVNGYTALHWAAKFGNLDIIKLVAGTHNVNVNIKSRGGFTPLHVAFMFDKQEAVDLLIQTYKADLNVRDHSGRKAMQYRKPLAINSTTTK